MVSGAIPAGDMKMFSVAYVGGFMAMCLLRDRHCDTYKKCAISEVPLIFAQDSRSTAVQYSLLDMQVRSG